VECVNDGSAALQKLDGPHDFAVLDLMMRLLRQTIVTTRVSQRDFRRIDPDGVFNMRKPFDMERLLLDDQRLCEREGKSRARRTQRAPRRRRSQTILRTCDGARCQCHHAPGAQAARRLTEFTSIGVVIRPELPAGLLAHHTSLRKVPTPPMHPTKRLQLLLLFVFLFTAITASATLTSSNQKQMYADYNEDVEPAMISQVRSGVEYNVTAFIKYFNTVASMSNPQLAFSAYNSNGSSVANTLPKLSGYSQMVDPTMAQNPTTQRIFLVGLAKNADTGTATALALYTSDDGGFSWFGPTKIYETTGGVELDKPSIAISPDTVNGTGGYAYIGVMRNDSTGHQPIVLVSTSGVSYSATPYLLPWSSGNATDPQVMVNNNGDVYVAVTDAGVNNIRLAKSYPFNVGLFNPMCFTELTPALTPTYPARLENTDYYAGLVPSNSSVHAASVPVAKLDLVHQRIGVAWHENSIGGGAGPHRIAFAYTPIGDTGTSWSSPHLITNGVGQDINVAMDVDTNGGFLVSYYSFAQYSNYYYPMASYVTINTAGTVSHETPIALTSNLSDITVYAPNSFGGRALGEYHDVSFSNGTFKVVGIVLVAQGNPWIWTVTHF